MKATLIALFLSVAICIAGAVIYTQMMTDHAQEKGITSNIPDEKQ